MTRAEFVEQVTQLKNEQVWRFGVWLVQKAPAQFFVYGPPPGVSNICRTPEAVADYVSGMAAMSPEALVAARPHRVTWDAEAATEVSE